MSQAKSTDDPDTALEGEWVVWDLTNDNQRTADSRSDAEDMIGTLEDLADGDAETELFKPGDAVPQVSADEYLNGDTDEPADPEPAPDTNHEPEVLSPEEVEQAADELPERNVGQDPLKWLPGEFVDTIDGSPAINRKGFEVLGHFYDVAVSADLQVAPEDTDHKYARVKATAEIDGRTVEAFGSAHVDRGDDSYLLLEMAGTRARKRALSIATGAGAVAVAELKNEPGE